MVVARRSAVAPSRWPTDQRNANLGIEHALTKNSTLRLNYQRQASEGRNQGLGNYSLGVGADVLQKYRFDLKYIDYLGHYRDNGTAVTSTNGLTTFLRDRGAVSLTFKTTF